jgi:hypothetical protein
VKKKKGGKSIEKISLMSEGFCVQTQGTGREDRALSYLSSHVFLPPLPFSRSVAMVVFDASCLSCVLACNFAVIDVIKTTI